MKKVKFGFTLVEVSLFLAITGMLFVGIVAGVQGSMFSQRYNDSVQSFAEFLRSIYSQVMNVENNTNVSNGQSEMAIYGKLVTFGEENGFNDSKNDGGIFSYTVIGEAEIKKDEDGKVISGNFGSGNALEQLANLNANVVIKKEVSGTSYPELAGIAEEYYPRWGAGIQATDYESFKGALLIVRSPRTGTVFTYVMKGKTVEVNVGIKEATSFPDNLLVDYLKDDSEYGFKIQEVDFCVNPDGYTESGPRRDIRIINGARNASGVEIIGQDDDPPEGNRCK